MSQILQLRDRVVALLKRVAPGLDVAGHLGRFDEEELRQFLVKAPGIRVAVLGIEPAASDATEDTLNLTVRLGIYVVTKDGARREDRVGAALGLVETVVLFCDRQRWGLNSFVRQGQVAGAQLIYSQNTRTAGVAFWAIDLRQPVQLSKAAPEAGQLTRAFAGLAPNIGLGHEPDYVPLAAPPATGGVDV